MALHPTVKPAQADLRTISFVVIIVVVVEALLKVHFTEVMNFSGIASFSYRTYRDDRISLS